MAQKITFSCRTIAGKIGSSTHLGSQFECHQDSLHLTSLWIVVILNFFVIDLTRNGQNGVLLSCSCQL